MEFLTLLRSNVKKRLSKWVGMLFANSQMEELQQPPMTIHSWELNMNLLNPVSCTWVIVARAVCMRGATWQPTTLKGKLSQLHVKLHEQIVFLFFCLKFCCHCRGFFFFGWWVFVFFFLVESSSTVWCTTMTWASLSSKQFVSIIVCKLLPHYNLQTNHDINNKHINQQTLIGFLPGLP